MPRWPGRNQSVIMPPFEEQCGPILYLTVRRGPHAGMTSATCTCGWERTYKTRRGAERCGRDHLRIANGKKEP